MTVKDFISKVQENYTEIAINEYDGSKHTDRAIIDRHQCNIENVPERFINREISGFVLYYDRISIEIEKGGRINEQDSY